jgi:peptide/nickel transport system permease protein
MERIIKGQTYVYFAQSLGASEWTILRRHILHIMIGPVIVVGTMGVAYAHLTGEALSFTGLGHSCSPRNGEL